MSNYSKTTNFAAKDGYASGNTDKIVKGTEIDTEFNNIVTAITTKADLASPAFTGTPTVPDASSGTSTSQIANTKFVTTTFPASDNTYAGKQTFIDNKFEITDNSDTTKILNVQLSGITTATTRTLTVQDKDGTIALSSDITGTPLSTTANTILTAASYTLSSGSYNLVISASNASTNFLVGQSVQLTFTNTSGSSLTDGIYVITATTTTTFTVSYINNTTTSGGTVNVERYGLIAVANSVDMAAGTSYTKAVTPKQFIDNKLVARTAVSASGIEIPFTSIPSWVKRITVSFNALSLNSATTSTKVPYIQLGTGSTPTYTTSGYTGVINMFNTGPNTDYTLTSGAPLYASNSTLAATGTITGNLVFVNITSNTWIFTGVLADNVSRSGYVSGSISLGSALTALRFYVDGTITFDAGTVNIMYE